MQKISSYLYPNRIELLADLAGYSTEFTNVYQRIVKLYNGIDNTIEFDIKNADQKRINLSTLSNIELNVMDASGQALPSSPYEVVPLNQTTYKGLASVTIPEEDLSDLTNQFLKFSVTAIKDGKDVMLYGDSRFGASGTFEIIGSAMPVFRDPSIYKTFTGEIDLKGIPTYHSSAIPATFYEAVPTETLSFNVYLKGFTGSVWLEATKQSTINLEAFKGAQIINSTTLSNFTGLWSPTVNSSTEIPVDEYKYFRISYTTPYSNGIGSSYNVALNNGSYTVTIRAGGTGYAPGSQIKVLGSVIGGVDGINDLIITVTAVDASSGIVPSSYAISSVSAISWSGVAASGSATYIVSGTNITGTVDKVEVD